MTTTEATTALGFTAALVRMSHLVQHVFADVSHDHEITPQQAQLLCILIDGPIGMTDLSRLLHLEKSSLTGLVDRVERRGLVTRIRDGRDRRVCQVALTGEGTRLAVEAHQDVTRRLDALADDLPDAEKERVASAVVSVLDRHGVFTRRSGDLPRGR
jgi:DNA-binding MarR family transcriptional regulator